MRLIIFLFMCFLSQCLIAQIEQESSYNYVNVSGDNAYVLDSLTYTNGSLHITQTATQDSATLRATVASDTLRTVGMISNYQDGYNRYKARIDALQALKTNDSLRLNYWTDRLTQQRTVIDSIAAN